MIVQCSRLQLPLKLAWAVTIHKSQGLTLDKVVIDVGEREFSCGLTYVACSRVRQLTDFLFSPPFPFQRLSCLANNQRLHDQQLEDQRLLTMQPPLQHATPPHPTNHHHPIYPHIHQHHPLCLLPASYRNTLFSYVRTTPSVSYQFHACTTHSTSSISYQLPTTDTHTTLFSNVHTTPSVSLPPTPTPPSLCSSTPPPLSPTGSLPPTPTPPSSHMSTPPPLSPTSSYTTPSISYATLTTPTQTALSHITCNAKHKCIIFCVYYGIIPLRRNHTYYISHSFADQCWHK